jgi:hypothetical protein
MTEPLKRVGVGRDGDNAKALVLYFSREPTDDEMRAVGDMLDGVAKLMAGVALDQLRLFAQDVRIETLEQQLREATNLDTRDAELTIMRRALRACLATWCPNPPGGDGADGDTYRMATAALEGKDGR